MRALARDADPDTLRRHLAGGAVYLAQMVPEVRALLPDLPDGPGTSSLETEDARFPLFDALAAFLKSVAAVRPLVLLLDDLHAADEPSLLLLHFVSRDLAGARLLFVGTYGDVAVQHQPERARMLSSVPGAARTSPPTPPAYSRSAIAAQNSVVVAAPP